MSSNDSPTSKKNKSHSSGSKIKIRKPRPVSDDEFSNELVIVDDIPPPPKLVKQVQIQIPGSKMPGANNSNKKRKRRDSGSSDEERWLTAIESGKLEDVDEELKKIKPKDPSLMTARQRAMYDRGADGPQGTPMLMSLPTGYKEKVMTAEAIQKAALKSQKRKQLADEKREKDKKKTMDRLLKKQESKSGKSNKNKVTRSAVPVIIYKQSLESTIMNFPEGIDFPIKKDEVKSPPKLKLCEMGCGNIKKYSCSTTGVALCSLECYKKNLKVRGLV